MKKKKFIKFFLGGALGTILSYLSYEVSANIIFGVEGYLFSLLLAFLLNTIVSFHIHRVWTFKNKKKEEVAKKLHNYVNLSVTFFIFNSLLLFFLVDFFYMNYLWAQILIGTILFLPNYFASKEIFTD